MKNSLEKTSSLGRKLNIEVPMETVSSTFEKVYKGIQRNATIKGFRKGKAPLSTIKSIYAGNVHKDVLEDLVSNHYLEALKEHKLDPVAQPQVKIESPLVETESFKFIAEFEIRPEIQLKKIEKLKVDKEKIDVSDEKIDSVIQQIRESRAQLVPNLEDRPAQNKDTVDINFFGTIEGKPLDGGAMDGHKLELGSNSFIPGFEDGLLGMRIGQKRELNLNFPSDYGHKEIAGKPVKFEVTLNAILKKQLPELNDEFVKSTGGFSSIDELKNAIREDILKQETKRIQDDVKTKLLKELVKENPVEVPASLRVQQKQFLIADSQKRMKEQGMSEADFATYVTKWDKDFDDTADFMIRSSFLIDALADKFKLSATQVDMEDRLSKYAASTGIEMDKLKSFYYGSHERKHQLKYQITEEKVVDYLLEKADVSEVKRT